MGDVDAEVDVPPSAKLSSSHISSSESTSKTGLGREPTSAYVQDIVNGSSVIGLPLASAQGTVEGLTFASSGGSFDNVVFIDRVQ